MKENVSVTKELFVKAINSTEETIKMMPEKEQLSGNSVRIQCHLCCIEKNKRNRKNICLCGHNQYHRSSSSSQIYWALCGTRIHNRCIWFNGSVPLF